MNISIRTLMNCFESIIDSLDISDLEKSRIRAEIGAELTFGELKND